MWALMGSSGICVELGNLESRAAFKHGSQHMPQKISGYRVYTIVDRRQLQSGS